MMIVPPQVLALGAVAAVGLALWLGRPHTALAGGEPTSGAAPEQGQGQGGAGLLGLPVGSAATTTQTTPGSGVPGTGATVVADPTVVAQAGGMDSVASAAPLSSPTVQPQPSTPGDTPGGGFYKSPYVPTPVNNQLINYARAQLAPPAGALSSYQLRSVL